MTNKKAALDRELLNRLQCATTPRWACAIALCWRSAGPPAAPAQRDCQCRFRVLVDHLGRLPLSVGPRSQTNESGAVRPQNLKLVLGEAAQALQAWLDVLDDQGIERSARIFRQMLRGGFVGEAVSAKPCARS